MDRKRMSPAYQYRAKVVRVIDADTLQLDIDLGFHTHVIIEGRVNGVDAPEMSTQEGIRARQAVVDLVGLVQTVLVVSVKDHRSFARWIVDIWVDDLSLAMWLQTHGYVKGIPRFESDSLSEQARGKWYGQ